MTSARQLVKAAFGGYGNPLRPPAPAAVPPAPQPPASAPVAATPPQSQRGLTSPHAPANIPQPRLSAPAPPVIPQPQGTRGILPSAAYPGLQQYGQQIGVDTTTPHFRMWWHGKRQDPHTIANLAQDPARLVNLYALDSTLQRDLQNPAYGDWNTNFWGNLSGMRREIPGSGGNIAHSTPGWLRNVEDWIGDLGEFANVPGHQQYRQLVAASRQPGAAGSNVAMLHRPERSWGQWGRDVGDAVLKTAPLAATGLLPMTVAGANAASSGDTGPLMSLAYDAVRPLNAAMDTDFFGNIDMRARPQYGVGIGSGVDLSRNPAGPRHLLYGGRDYVTGAPLPSTANELATAHQAAADNPATGTAGRIGHNVASATFGSLPFAAAVATPGAGLRAAVPNMSGRLAGVSSGAVNFGGAMANPLTHLVSQGIQEIPTGEGIGLGDRMGDWGRSIRQAETLPAWLRQPLAAGVEAVPATVGMGVSGARSLFANSADAARTAGQRVAQYGRGLGVSHGVNTAMSGAQHALTPQDAAQLQARMHGLPSDTRRQMLFDYQQKLDEALRDPALLDVEPAQIEQMIRQQIFGGVVMPDTLEPPRITQQPINAGGSNPSQMAPPGNVRQFTPSPALAPPGGSGPGGAPAPAPGAAKPQIPPPAGATAARGFRMSFSDPPPQPLAQPAVPGERQSGGFALTGPRGAGSQHIPAPFPAKPAPSPGGFANNVGPKPGPAASAPMNPLDVASQIGMGGGLPGAAAAGANAPAGPESPAAGPGAGLMGVASSAIQAAGASLAPVAGQIREWLPQIVGGNSVPPQVSQGSLDNLQRQNPGASPQSLMQMHSQMSPVEKLLLWSGLGIGTIGLLTAMHGRSGLAPWLMAALGLGTAAFAGGRAGMLGEGMQSLTSGISDMVSGNNRVPVGPLGRAATNLMASSGAISPEQIAQGLMPHSQQVDRLLGEGNWGNQVLGWGAGLAGMPTDVLNQIGVPESLHEPVINAYRRMRQSQVAPPAGAPRR